MHMCAAVDAEVGLRPHGKVSKILNVSAGFFFFVWFGFFFFIMERFGLWIFKESVFLLPVFNFQEGTVILASPLQFSVLGADT